jgi:hypothetical protein
LSQKTDDYQSVWERGSDDENDVLSDDNNTFGESKTDYSTVKESIDVPTIGSTADNDTIMQASVAQASLLYERLIMLWLRAWVEHVHSLNETYGVSLSPRAPMTTFAIPNSTTLKADDAAVFSFFAHIDFLLPLCYKSLVLSCNFKPSHGGPIRVNGSHMKFLEPFVKVLAKGLMGIALGGLGSTESRDASLLHALIMSEHVVNFLIGLLSVLQTNQMQNLIVLYFKTLHESETDHLSEKRSGGNFEWTEESLHRVRCSRQLRIHAIEMFACIPAFLMKNHPMKFIGKSLNIGGYKESWTHQKKHENEVTDFSWDNYSIDESSKGRPTAGWLVSLLTNEALSISALSSEAVVAEALAHIEMVNKGSGNLRTPALTSALKKRPGAALQRGDLLMFQSLAIHSIVSLYELVLRRHAMDKRFQSQSSRERITSQIAPLVLEKLVSNARWLARMEATHKVRSIWLLCFIYILQEAPELMIRQYIVSLCDAKVRVHIYLNISFSLPSTTNYML